jgi:hypothetical protein
MDIPQWVQALAALASAWVAYAAWRVAKTSSDRADKAEKDAADSANRLNFLIGSIESHSTLHLRMAAKAAGVKVIWWDPTIEPPPFPFTHGDVDKLEEIRSFLPLDRRQGQRGVQVASATPDGDRIGNG